MATVNFRLRKPTVDGKLKEVPCPINVIYNSKLTGRLEIGTGEKVLPKNWKVNRVKPAEKYYDTINKHLAKIEEALLNLWRDNKDKSAEELKALVRKTVTGEFQGEQKKTVIQAVQQFIAQYEREKEIGTVKRYRALLQKLIAFNPDLTFEELDFNFYDAFKRFLYRQRNQNYTGYHLRFDSSSGVYMVSPGVDDANAIGLFDDVVFKYFINLKTICSWATKRGYTPHNSFRQWEIIKREYEPISLTLDELRKIEALHLPEKHLDTARDYLSLECRTGQRISDLRRFNKDDVSGNTWTFTQKKGNRIGAKRISLPLVGYCAPALVILQKYNYELPAISEQKLNKHIKTVCNKAGVTTPMYIERWAGNKKIRIPGTKDEFISTHTGRKTFITIALQFMKPHVVMQITGIKEFKTLKHYAGESELSTIEAGLRSIEDNISIMRKAN